MAKDQKDSCTKLTQIAFGILCYRARCYFLAIWEIYVNLLSGVVNIITWTPWVPKEWATWSPWTNGCGSGLRAFLTLVNGAITLGCTWVHHNRSPLDSPTQLAFKCSICSMTDLFLAINSQKTFCHSLGCTHHQFLQVFQPPPQEGMYLQGFPYHSAMECGNSSFICFMVRRDACRRPEPWGNLTWLPNFLCQQTRLLATDSQLMWSLRIDGLSWVASGFANSKLGTPKNDKKCTPMMSDSNIAWPLFCWHLPTIGFAEILT